MTERDLIRNELLQEIIIGIDQTVELYQTGGSAPLAGHAYDPSEHAKEVKLLRELQAGFKDMLVE